MASKIQEMFDKRLEEHKEFGMWKGNAKLKEALWQFYRYGIEDRRRIACPDMTHIPEEYDRRRKLLKKDIEDIRQMHKHGKSVKQIAKLYNVTYATIYLWLNPDRKNASLEYNRMWHRMNPRSSKEQASLSKSTSAYKRKLRKEGKL